MSVLYRKIPAVDVLLADDRLQAIPRDVSVWVIREVIAELREQIRSEAIADVPDVIPLVVERTQTLLQGRIKPVLNATGVMIHTNLGRSPWPQAAVDAAAEVAGGYCNLELELDDGKRGGRLRGIATLLRYLTGAEDALVVNNCAAAVLLSLTALAKGRGVLVSRGELVEIGGSFRVPDVIASGGASLCEVGTTNRTRVSDYAARVDEQSAVLLKVHRSNFQVVGFTEDTSLAALVALGNETGLVVVVDQGCGSLSGGADEDSVEGALAAGADVVLFSGDKLFGGPQCGFAVGKKTAIQRLRKHPLYRALRIDKSLLAAAEATLVLHAKGEYTPLAMMLNTPLETLEMRAQSLLNALEKYEVRAEVSKDKAFIGGGAMPGEGKESRVVCVDCRDLDGVARSLRCGSPAVVPRVAGGRLLFDMRTLGDFDAPRLAAAVAKALSKG